MSFKWPILATVVLASMFGTFILGLLSGKWINEKYLQKQHAEFIKKQLTSNKNQIKEILTAIGRKPSEEQINRLVTLSKKNNKKNQRKKKI